MNSVNDTKKPDGPAAVPRFPRVYVIGHKASRVTIYAQQVRALNLIWALNEQNPLEGKNIVVVGGGIAGVTTAAATDQNWVNG